MIKLPEDINKKFSYIETILNRLARRSHKSVVVISPVSVISGYAKEIPEDGIILRCLFPCSGIIKGITTSFDGVSGSKLIVKLSIGTNEYTNPTENIKVNANDKLAVKVDGVGSNIYFSISFVADNEQSEKEKLAIEALDKTTDEE